MRFHYKSEDLKDELFLGKYYQVFLLIFCRFVSEADELASTILIIAAPLWLFTTLFAVFAYKDLYDTIGVILCPAFFKNVHITSILLVFTNLYTF